MVKQLSVFLENKSGKIAAITRMLYESGIDIRALSIADTTDYGILRMLVNDIHHAEEVLFNQNCIISVNEVAVVAVPDVPGGVYQVLDLLAREKIDIEYMYSLIDRGVDVAYMVFRVQDVEGMQALLESNGLKTVSAETLGLK